MRKTWEFVEFFDEAGITHEQERILIALRENGPLSNQEVSNLVNRDTGNTSKRIHTLISRGLLFEKNENGSKLFEYIEQG